MPHIYQKLNEPTDLLELAVVLNHTTDRKAPVDTHAFKSFFVKGSWTSLHEGGSVNYIP